MKFFQKKQKKELFTTMNFGYPTVKFINQKINYTHFMQELKIPKIQAIMFSSELDIDNILKKLKSITG